MALSSKIQAIRAKRWINTTPTTLTSWVDAPLRQVDIANQWNTAIWNWVAFSSNRSEQYALDNPWLTATSSTSFSKDPNTWVVTEGNNTGTIYRINWEVVQSPNTVAKTSPVTSPANISWPSTAGNFTKAQTAVQIWGQRKYPGSGQDIGNRSLEDISTTQKKEEIAPSFDFSTQLSNLYWKWLTDKSAIFWELSKDKSFAALDSTKQQDYITQMSNNIKEMNAAKASADMTNQNFDPAEYARQKWFDIQTGDVKEIQKWRKEITDTLKYKGSIYDTNVEDMQFKKEQTIKQLDQNIEQTRLQVQRQTEDVMKQAQQTVDMGEKVWALKWYNKSGWYVQWLMEVQNQAMQNIQRLQQDLARAEMLTGEDKALAMQEYEKNMKRHKEEFDYNMRSVISEWQAELGRLVMGKYDPKKLWEMLDNLSYDVIQKRMNIEAQYINNMKSANDVVSQQFDQFRAMDDYTDKQRQEFTSIINQNDGEALASMSAKDIENFVSQGMLSPEQWAAYYQSMVSKTVWALSQYGIPNQQDIDTIINSIKSGLSPLQSVAWVVQSNPNRYSSVKDKFMTVWKDSNIFNTSTGQFMTAPWVTGSSTWSSQVRLNEQPVAIGIQNVYGSDVKLAPTVGNMVNNAQSLLSQQGITLKIWDSYRSNAVQKQAYESWKPWVAEPWKSFHEIWQAFDLSQKSADWMNNEKVFQALRDSWLQQHPWERRHWSYWEFGNNKWASLGDQWWDKDVLFWLARKLIEDWSYEPKDIVALWYDPKEFGTIASKIYFEWKEQEINWVWWKIVNKDAFNAADKTVKKNITSWLDFYKNLLSDIDLYKQEYDKYWAEMFASNDNARAMSAIRDRMALSLKEVTNLWVLNGKDYDILLTQIPNLVWTDAKRRSKSSTENLFKIFKEDLTKKANNKLSQIWVKFTWDNSNYLDTSSTEKTLELIKRDQAKNPSKTAQPTQPTKQPLNKDKEAKLKALMWL